MTAADQRESPALWIDEVLSFWFGELSPDDWYKKDDDLDAVIRDRFMGLHETLATIEPQEATTSAKRALATVIALDQFPRNAFRGSPRQFATDGLALAIATLAIDRGLDDELSPVERQFLYLPFQHSEDAEVQTRSLALFERLGDPVPLDFAKRHKEIIDRFGRFPHRNEALGRSSTREEIAFLQEPNSSF